MEDKDLIKAVEDATLDNMFPLLKSALAFGDAAKETQSKRFIQDVVVEINAKLWRLEQRVDKEYMKTEDFANFLHKMLLKAALDLRKEKKNLFANVIVNATLKEFADVNDRWKYLYGETIDKIDVELFRFLLNVKARCITKGKELEYGWTDKEPELLAMGIDQTTFRMNADYLMSTGLMTRIHQMRYDKAQSSITPQDEYYVTEFGTGFIGFVRERDDVELAEVEEI